MQSLIKAKTRQNFHPIVFIVFVLRLLAFSNGDPVHSDLYHEFNVEQWELLNEISKMPIFLRLENICQLGFKKYLFPHANNTRAAHCRGACTIAGIYVDSLNRNSSIEDHIIPIQKKAIQVAALLHDVGHGPYSHLFEEIISTINSEWTHEKQSIEIIGEIFKSNQLVAKYSLPEDFFEAVCDMIMGIDRKTFDEKYSTSKHFNRFFLFTIVNGKYSAEVDVDKFDYLKRDSFVACNPKYTERITNSVDSIIRNSKIENEEIVYSKNVARDLFFFSHYYYMNHRYLYYTPQGDAIDLMILDIFKSCLECQSNNKNNSFKKEYSIYQTLKGTTQSISKFVSMNDTSLYDLFAGVIKSHPKKYRLARSVLDRLETRDYYKFLGYHDFSYNYSPNGGSIRPEIDKAISLFEGIKKNNCRSKHLNPGVDYEFVTKNISHLRKYKSGNGEVNILKLVKFIDMGENTHEFYCASEYLKDEIDYLTSKPMFLPCNSSVLNRKFDSEPIPFEWGVIQLRIYCKSNKEKNIQVLQTITNQWLSRLSNSPEKQQ